MSLGFETLDMSMKWQDQKAVKSNGGWILEGRAPAESYPVFQEHPSNLPGKTVIGLMVTYPPAGGTPPHYHGGAAVFATMIKGKSVMQMVCPDHDPKSQGTGAKVYGPADSWYEPPGCHHVRSHNASDEEECQFIATFIVDTARVERLGVTGAVLQIDAAEEEAGRKPGQL